MFNTSKQSFDLLGLLFEVKTGEYFNDSTSSLVSNSDLGNNPIKSLYLRAVKKCRKW